MTKDVVSKETTSILLNYKTDLFVKKEFEDKIISFANNIKINLSKHDLATLRILKSYLPRDVFIKKSIKKPLQVVSYKTFETVRKHFVLLVVY